MNPDLSLKNSIRLALEGYCEHMRQMIAKGQPGKLQNEVVAQLLADYQLSPSTVTAQEVEKLEAGLPCRLPHSYKIYLQTCHHAPLEWSEYILPTLPQLNSLQKVAGLLRHRELWPAGYLQFASGPCGDPVCFDFQSDATDGEYPIVVFDHNLVPWEAWQQRETLEPFAKVVAPDFLKLVESFGHGKPLP